MPSGRWLGRPVLGQALGRARDVTWPEAGRPASDREPAAPGRKLVARVSAGPLVAVVETVIQKRSYITKLNANLSRFFIIIIK